MVAKEFEDSDYQIYLYGKPEVDPWGWWTINKKLEAQAQRYDPNRLLRTVPPRNIAWDHTNIREATSDDLGDMLSYFGAQAAFIGAELGMLRGAHAAVSASIEIALARDLSALEKENADRRRPLKAGLEADAITNSPLLSAGKHQEIELNAQIRVADGFYTAMDRLWQGVSREITRREQEFGRRHS